jgi:hypothetical protein
MERFTRGEVVVQPLEEYRVRVRVGSDRTLDLSISDLDELIEAGSELRHESAMDRELAERVL